MTTPPPSTFSCSADAVDAQQARQDRLDELYHQDGRHEPSHPMHGLYTGLVMTASTTTSPQNAMADEFVFFTQNKNKNKIAIRKSYISAFFCAYSGETIIEYKGDSAIVVESFDEVCAALGIAAPQQEPQPSEREINAIEALHRLRQWGGVANDSSINNFVMNDVVNWIDKGMNGPLPPLPDYLVLRKSVNYSLEPQP